MGQRWNRVTVALLGVAVAALYATRLDFAPIYLLHDEVNFSLQAASVAATGRDLNGRLLPVYFSEPAFPAGRDPIMIYAAAAVLTVLPLSEASVRLPTALVSVAAVLLILLLARRMLTHEGLAVATAAMFALSPGAFIHGRMALSVMYPIPFVVVWLICLERYQRDQRRTTLVAAGTALVLAGYGYLAGMVMMPVYVAASALWLRERRSLIEIRWILMGVAIGLIPLLLWQVAYPERFAELLGGYRVGDSGGRGSTVTASLLSVDGARLRLGMWWNYFNPEYLFLSGDSSMTNSTRGAGLFPLALAVFLPIGLRRLWRGTPLDRLIAVGFITAPLAVVMTGTLDLNRYRALLVLPFGALTAGAGVEALWRAKGRAGRWVAVLLLATIPYQFWGFYSDYMGSYRTATSTWFGRNVRGAVVAVLSTVRPGEPVFLSNRVPYADAYWRFYAGVLRRPEHAERFTVVDSTTFAAGAAPEGSWVVCGIDDPLGIVLGASSGWRVAHEITEPDGSRSFVVFRKLAIDVLPGGA